MTTYLYILKSQKNNSYYIGITNNLSKRIEQHNLGKVFSTKYKIPFKLIFSQEFPDKATAMAKEKQLKSWKKRKAIERYIKNYS